MKNDAMTFLMGSLRVTGGLRVTGTTHGRPETHRAPVSAEDEPRDVGSSAYAGRTVSKPKQRLVAPASREQSGARFWGQVQGPPGRFRALQGRGAQEDQVA